MKRLWLICVVILFSLVLCGCAKEEADIKEQLQEAQALREQGIAYEVTDEAGRKLSFQGKPKRIASLTYGTDEILTELVDSKRIVAYSRWAGDPEITFITKEQARKVGCKLQENAEAVLAVQPDLVVVSAAMSSDVIGALEAMGLKVYVASRPKNYEQMRQKVLKLAEAVGEKHRGEAIVQSMDRRMAALNDKLSQIPRDKRRTVVAFNFISAMGRKDDLIDNMLNMAHVINGVAQIPSEYMNNYVSKEQVVRINPDIFLLPTWNYDKRQDLDGYAKRIQLDPAYKDVKAIKNNQIKFVSDKYRYVASHHIVDAVESLAQAVYPEVFRGEKFW